MQTLTDNNLRTTDAIAVSQETAARMLGVTARTLRNWERDGKVTPVMIGKLKRYRVADLRKLAGETVAAGE